MVEGKQAGEVHWLRTESSAGTPLYAGLWRCDPMTFDYTFPGDETFHCLAGELRIRLESGEEVVVQEGDVASFDKGVKSVWTVTRPFAKVFVIT
jgi:hypothetical protein